MSSTSGEMGLTRWNDPNDLFSYTELHQNWAKVEAHDHTTGKGVQIPTAGIANLAVSSSKLAADSVIAGKIPAASIAGDRLINSTVPDTKLASPNNTVWRTLQTFVGVQGAGASAATVYGFSASGTMVATAGTNISPALVFPWDDAHYLVAGKTIKLRILGAVLTNATAPAANVSLSLNSISSNAGGAALMSTTWGAAVAGSTVSVTTPGASTRNVLTGSSFDVPADGVYGITATFSAIPAASSWFGINALLQISHV